MRIPASEYRQSVKPKKPSKYRNRKTVLDGVTYDSKAEAKYAYELKLREKAGEVTNVQLQVPFNLMAYNGRVVGVYRADFTFYDNIQKKQRVIDVKGFETPLFKLKKKLVEALYGLEIECVRVRS